MKTLNLNVTADSVQLVDPVPQITTGEYRVTQVSFCFSEEWNNLEIKARFGNIEETVVNNSCYLPMFEKSGVLTIKVFGYRETVINGDTVKELVYSPVPARLRVEIGSYDGTAGGSIPVPSPDEDADYLTKARLWSGFSMFFNSLENVSQDIKDEFESIDILKLTTAEVEETIENMNKLLLEDYGAKFLTSNTEQRDVRKTLVNSMLELRSNNDILGNGYIAIKAMTRNPYIEVYRNGFKGLGVPANTERLQIYVDKIVYGSGEGGGITEEKIVYFPNANVNDQGKEKFVTTNDIPEALGLLDGWGFSGTVYEVVRDIYENLNLNRDEVFFFIGSWWISHQNTITEEIDAINDTINSLDTSAVKALEDRINTLESTHEDRMNTLESTQEDYFNTLWPMVEELSEQFYYIEKDLILYLWNGFYKYFKEPRVVNGQTIPSRYENLKNTSFANEIIEQLAQIFFDKYDALETKIAEHMSVCSFADIYNEMLDAEDWYNSTLREQSNANLSSSISELSMSWFNLQTDVNNIKEDLAGIDTLLTEILGDEVTTNE